MGRLTMAFKIFARELEATGTFQGRQLIGLTVTEAGQEAVLTDRQRQWIANDIQKEYLAKKGIR